MMKEIWVAVKGYEGSYEVSNIGRVRSIDREIVMSHGGIKFCQGQLLKITVCTSGYNRVSLYDENRKQKTWRVHKLVALHFIENPNGFSHINHLNEDGLDDRAENLFWTTKTENNSRGASIGHKIRKGA